MEYTKFRARRPQGIHPGLPPLLWTCLCPSPASRKGQASVGRLMVDGEGGSGLGKQETQEGLPSPQVWSGTQKKKSSFVFSHSLATPFPLTGSVALASVWHAVGSCLTPAGFPFDLPIGQHMHSYFLSSVWWGLCQQRMPERMDQLSVFVVLIFGWRGELEKKKKDRKYRHQGPEVETIQLVREQNPSGQDGWRGATGVCNGEGVF